MFLPCRPCCGGLVLPSNCGVSIGATTVYAHITAADYEVRFSTTTNSTLGSCSSGSGYEWAYYFPGNEYDGTFELTKISAVVVGTLGQAGSSYTEIWRYYYPDTATLCFDPQSYVEVESSLTYITQFIVQCKVVFKAFLYGFYNCNHEDPSFVEEFDCDDLGCADGITPNAGACFLKTSRESLFSQTAQAFSPGWSIADLESLSQASGSVPSDQSLRCAINTLCGTFATNPAYTVVSRTGTSTFTGYVEFEP